MNNEKFTGVSIIKINEKIDYGDILMQEKVLIDKDEDYGTLKNKLSVIGSKILYKTIDLILKNQIKRKQIITKMIKKLQNLLLKNTRINWDSSIDSIIGKIRGASSKTWCLDNFN